MKTLKGMVQFQPIGIGRWTFVAQDGGQYEILGGDPSLYRDGLRATITGKVRDDLMSAGNLGPIFEVNSSKIEPA